MESKQKAAFTLPQVPTTLTSPQSRAEYLTLHYWDNFDFADTTLISNPEITEQAFVDFINLLPYATNSAQALTEMLEGSTADSAMFVHFQDLAEKYLYDPNSPMRNEELYIPVLEYVVASDKVDTLHKIRPQYQLEMALKNRPGRIAADFTYTLCDGRSAKMSALNADYTLLFFNNPDCTECKRVKKYMADSRIIGELTKKNLKILAVYVDGDIPLWRSADYPKCMINSYDATQSIQQKNSYDLKAIPTLYLLDKDKRVLLKDAPIEAIEAWFEQTASSAQNSI